jgi:predicted DNA binding CopG/RHH family protein
MEKLVNSKISRIACELPTEMANAFRSKVAAEGLNIKEVMTKLIEDYLKKGNKKF